MNSFRFLEHAEASIRREVSTDGRDAAEIKNDLGGLMVMNIYHKAGDHQCRQNGEDKTHLHS